MTWLLHKDKTILYSFWRLPLGNWKMCWGSISVVLSVGINIGAYSSYQKFQVVQNNLTNSLSLR